ncbi:MAG: hypothetical protein MAG431_02320 [Chloroflexi bacterium]|nr:hypothetical protein [Chloroflexota bacterium]
MKSKFTLKIYFIIALIGGGLSLILLGILPQKPTEAWFLGFSFLRITLMILNLLVVVALLLLSNNRIKDSSWKEKTDLKIASFTHSEERKTHIFLLLLGGFAIGAFFIFYTFRTPRAIHRNYFMHFVPWGFWMAVLCAQTIVFLFMRDQKAWTAYFKKHGFALLALIIILGAGFALHHHLPEREPPMAYAATDEVSRKIEDQDIYYIYNEGLKLSQGGNPYARAAEIDEIRWNMGFPAHLPPIYYGSWLTHEAGFTEIFQWLSIWRRIFLFFNLAIAYLLFIIPYHRHNAIVLGIFGSLFWLFNRWTLHVTSIYQFDFIAIFFLLLSLSLLPKRKTASYLFFGLSLGIKHMAIFLVPVYLIWAWQENKEQPLKKTFLAGLTIASVPLLASLPFLIISPVGFIKSLMISVTRYPETHLGVLSLDAFLGWIGIPAKIPMLVMVLITCWLAWRKKLKPFSAGLLVMLIFVDFNSVLFRHYPTWVIPFLPLTVAETLTQAHSQGK